MPSIRKDRQGAIKQINFVPSRDELDLLENCSEATGFSKTAILRELIRNLKIEEFDRTNPDSRMTLHRKRTQKNGTAAPVQ